MVALLYTFLHFKQKKKIEPWAVAGLAGMAAGFLVMVMAPGNASRGALMKADETYSGIMAYVSRGLKINKAMNEYMMIYIVVICLLFAYFMYKGKNWKNLKRPGLRSRRRKRIFRRKRKNWMI